MTKTTTEKAAAKTRRRKSRRTRLGDQQALQSLEWLAETSRQLRNLLSDWTGGGLYGLAEHLADLRGAVGAARVDKRTEPLLRQLGGLIKNAQRFYDELQAATSAPVLGSPAAQSADPLPPLPDDVAEEWLRRQLSTLTESSTYSSADSEDSADEPDHRAGDRRSVAIILRQLALQLDLDEDDDD